MLHLNQQQLPNGGEGQGEDDAYKILVMDQPCISVLSPVLKLGDLRHHGVTLTLNIDRPRQAVPDAPAVYFVRPTPGNVDRIAADAAAGLYVSFHVNFSTSVPRPLLERLATACAAAPPACAGRVARVADQYIDFVCLEDGLFSLAQPRAYVALNDPAAADADITALIDAVALGLFCVVATLVLCLSSGVRAAGQRRWWLPPSTPGSAITYSPSPTSSRKLHLPPSCHSSALCCASSTGISSCLLGCSTTGATARWCMTCLA